jgi:hypothetical protein
MALHPCSICEESGIYQEIPCVSCGGKGYIVIDPDVPPFPNLPSLQHIVQEGTIPTITKKKKQQLSQFH